jgi:Fic family protein
MAKPHPLTKGVEEIISCIQEKYKADAYNSLSIEGYQVTTELIEKIESGLWDPENDEADRRQRDALAVKGYQQAFQAVLASVRRVVNRENPGQVFEEELQGWYRQMFAPLVSANLMKAIDLAGYRDQQVYIHGARHVPPPKSAIPDCMEKLFELLKNEENQAVAAVLGHFVFVFIHPYMDGNGRIGRFLMNLMLIAGGFDWTVIKVDHRDRYLAALEAASTQGDILPLAEFIKREMNG